MVRMQIFDLTMHCVTAVLELESSSVHTANGSYLSHPTRYEHIVKNVAFLIQGNLMQTP